MSGVIASKTPGRGAIFWGLLRNKIDSISSGFYSHHHQQILIIQDRDPICIGNLTQAWWHQGEGASDSPPPLCHLAGLKKQML